MGISKQFYAEGSLEIIGATLLSAEEAKEFLTEEERKYSRWWWLRSSGISQHRVAIVHGGGDVYENGIYVCGAFGAVRPALKILNLEKSNLKIGDIFRIDNYEFKIVSQNLAWLYNQSIGLEFFSDELNNYEKSHIKKYIDDWFEKEIKG